MRTCKVLIYLAAIVVAILIGSNSGIFALRADNISSAQTGALLPHPAKAPPDFKPVNNNQTPLTQTRLQQQWRNLYFGSIRCPGVCPTAFADLGTISRLLVKRRVPIVAVYAPPITSGNMADEYRNLVTGHGMHS